MIFVPVRTSTLKPDVHLSFEVYVKIQDRYVLYIRKGDDLRSQRLDNLKKQKVRQLFIPAEQEIEYQNFLDGFLLDAANNVMMSANQKSEVINGYATQATEEIYKDPSSKKSFTKAQKTAKGIIDIVAKNEDVLKHLVKANVSSDGTDNRSEILIRHSVNVSTIAARFGETLKLPAKDLENFCICGLFHDIGITKLAPRALELLFTPDKEFTNDDWVLYKKHPEAASSILQDKEFVSKDILMYIQHHEEKKSGTGFPSGTKKITPTEEIFNLCCYYSRQVMCLKVPPGTVLKNLMIDEVGNFELDLLQKFKAFLTKEGLT
jgi:HD-GYP domain-containing protein (c-di-GMP phosphodiesterase class II)